MRYRKSYTRKGRRITGRCIRSQTRSRESSAEMKRRLRGRMTKRFRGVRKSRRGLTVRCKKGMIRREAYVRYSKKGTRTLVPAACIRDVGRPGKGIRTGGPGIGPLRKGDLSQFGYERVTTLSVGNRRGALKKAVAAYGALTTWRKLNAVYVYTRITSPASSRVFKEDMNWIKATYGLKAF